MADTIGVIASFFGGAVSAGGLVAARVQRKLSKPKLSLEVDPNLEGSGPLPKVVAEKECAYVRLLARNGGGKDAATGVYVEIEDIEVIDGETPRGVSGLRGSWLAWADRELRNPNAEKTKETVGPGAAVPLDLVHLNASVPATMILDVRPQPPKPRPNYLGQVRLVLHLAVQADNADRARFVIEISHTGRRWAGWAEEAGSHISVGDLRAT